VLFLSPGARWLPEILEVLHEIRDRAHRTEVVIVADGEPQTSSPRITWVRKATIETRRPFAVYFGDGPAFAMIGQLTLAAARTPIFQTGDRTLVETLAFELQRELAIPLSV
jgi:hypothetical protein